mgnify:CR=1 FL=1
MQWCFKFDVWVDVKNALNRSNYLVQSTLDPCLQAHKLVPWKIMINLDHFIRFSKILEEKNACGSRHFDHKRHPVDTVNIYYAQIHMQIRRWKAIVDEVYLLMYVNCLFVPFMVLVLDDSTYYDVLVYSELGRMICWRHLSTMKLVS